MKERHFYGYVTAFLSCLLTLYFVSFSSSIRPTENAELNATLERSVNGRAAVVIIRVEDTTGEPTKYLVQRKSIDYPIKPFQNAVCLFGGNAELTDKEPMETLTRELGEELPPNFVHALLHSSNLTFLGSSMNMQTAEMLGKTEPYSFLCACYEARISLNQFQNSFPNQDINEGTHALLTKNQLLEDEKYAWGYDFIMSDYFGQPVKRFCDGVTVTKVDNDKLKDWIPVA
mmetsp:Transcript_17874/g.26444  ORF Transcript_17874/g.26444 Transcript_17874/m.26444 type:complete len:230 (+) Transcript_17874:95-784(+)